MLLMIPVLFNLLAEAWFVNILSIVGTAVAGLISFYVMELTKRLAKKAKNENLVAAISLVQKLIIDVVNTVQQTFVEQLKKDGKFDKEAQAKALEMAVQQVLLNTSAEAKQLITEAYGDFGKWITLQIESVIYSSLPHSK
jgi:uncharacterized membrane protein